jgi:hypothetical protein
MPATPTPPPPKNTRWPLWVGAVAIAFFVGRCTSPSTQVAPAVQSPPIADVSAPAAAPYSAIAADAPSPVAYAPAPAAQVADGQPAASPAFTPTQGADADGNDQTAPDPNDTSQPTLSNDDHYVNSDGAVVHSPAYAQGGTCQAAGATAQCADGTCSFSQHHSGTCSHHGGVATWY